MRTDQYRAIEVDELPEELQPGITYLELDGESEPWLVAFLCPCGCGETCHCVVRGRVIGEKGPTWVLHRHQGTITLEPSVHRIPERTCGAHFWLTQGKIRWC
jgi:hypothetical protein